MPVTNPLNSRANFRRISQADTVGVVVDSLLQVYSCIVGSAAQVSAGVATHTSIASAISAASAGGNILVLRGTYTENVTVPKEVHLEGAGRGAVLNGTLTFASASTLSSWRRMKIADNVVFSVGANGIFFETIWIATTKTVTDGGVANYKTYITE